MDDQEQHLEPQPVDPLDALAAAVQAFVNTVSDTPALVDNAVVLYEAVSFDEAGNTQRQIRYVVPTDNFTLSGSLGLTQAGAVLLQRDVLGDD